MAIIELLREQEVGALVTLSAKGALSVATMHVASDGLVVYLHTFTNTRTYATTTRDSRVVSVFPHPARQHPNNGYSYRRIVTP